MTYTFDVTPANADRIVGRRVGELGEHIAVAFELSHGSQGYVLAVRHDGAQYAVWAVVPGPDRSIVVTGGHYFDAASYRHLDRHGAGHVGAYEAAHAWWLYCVGRSAGVTADSGEHA